MFFLNPTHPIGYAAMVTVVDSRRWAGKCKLVGQKNPTKKPTEDRGEDNYT
jgi:hypothetical protein